MASIIRKKKVAVDEKIDPVCAETWSSIALLVSAVSSMLDLLTSSPP
jgi:hypothetical protein